jgi:hypothetical protein
VAPRSSPALFAGNNREPTTMNTVLFLPIPEQEARRLQRDGLDAYGLAPERRSSGGNGVPCRHCLRNVEAGEDYLVLAYRPFPGLQPYAETGPIFLHASECPNAGPSRELAPMFFDTPDYILRGYGDDDRIVYGTGQVVPTGEIEAKAAELLAREDVAYLHMRSARNNCYQLRIERG